MIIRRLEANRVATMLSILGIAMGLAILVLGSFMEDTIAFVMDVQFGRAQRQDVMLTFNETQSPSAIYDALHLPGVSLAEPFRSVAVRLRHDTRQYRLSLMGLADTPKLYRVLDDQQQAIGFPEQHGLTVTQKLAELLDVKLGDEVSVEVLESDREPQKLIVASIFPNFTDPGAYLNRYDLHRFMKESERLSGVFLSVESAKLNSLYASVKETPSIAGVLDNNAARNNFRQLIQEMDEVEHHVAVTKANLRAAEFGLKVRAFQREQAVAASKRVNDKFQDRSTTALRIVSPTGGKILRVFREDSGVVAIGAPLVEVGDVQDLEMVLDILSSEAVRIEPGDHVFIERWGGDHSLKGIVRRIEPFAFLKVSALGVEEKRVNVIADFEDAWEVRQGLGDGFRIEARIVIHETDVNSLRVASGALFRHEDRWHVYRIRHGKVELVQVDVGASNGLEAEICSGLDESDVVVLYPTQQIRAGVRVLENR